jgi:hypothetical protein
MDDRMEDDRIGDLALRGLIGSGARGAVWRAERRGSPGRVLAVKLVDPERPAPARGSADTGGSRAADDSSGDGGARARAPQGAALDGIVTAMRNAATALRGVAHPALLPIEDVEVVGPGMIAVVLPYVAGGSLDDVLATRADRSLPPPLVVRLGADLADALAAAHAAGLRHGSLAPHDLLFDADGQVRLAGVGLADALEPQDPHPAAALRGAQLEDVRALAGLLADVVAVDAVLGPSPLRELLEQAATAPADDVDDGADRPLDAALLASRLQALADALPSPCNPVGQRSPGPEGTLGTAAEEGSTRLGPASPGSATPATTTSVGKVWGWRRRLGQAIRRGRELRPAVGASRPRGRASRDRSTRAGPRQPAWVRPVVATIVLLAATVVAAHGARSNVDPAAHDQADAAHAPPAPPGSDGPSGARPTPLVANPPPDAGPTPPATTSTDRVPDDAPRSVLRVPPAPCDRTARPPTSVRAGASQQVAIVDLDARGCGASVSYERGQLRVRDPDGRVDRFEVRGMDEDAVLLAGDWNCDGHEGIALYLPATGEALRVDRLPEPGGEMRAVTEPTRVRRGVASVRVDAAGCAELVVAPP